MTKGLVAAACWLVGTADAEPPKVDARAWLVENPVSGEVLAQHAQRYQIPIASITKLMTAMVVVSVRQFAKPLVEM